MNVEKIMHDLEAKHPGEAEYLQAVREVLISIEDVYNQHPEFEKAKLIERLVEPERIITFRVPWTDDNGEVHVNIGYRVQFNGAIGPYKGGLRFHPSVNLSILKFLGFEQTFKNALTTLPMGGGKGGSDFSIRGRSDAEVMRFCQAFMTELYRHIGPDEDVPAGDIGVGGREIGYLFGMYKKLTHQYQGVLTGKGLEFGGSRIRPEATGYGALYFVQQMLATRGLDLKDKTIAISGFGNVAWGAALKATELGGKVITISGPDGYIYDEAGIAGDKIDYMLELRSSGNDICQPYEDEFPGSKFVNARTQDKAGKILPVVITYYTDKSFSFVIKTPPAAVQLKEAAKVKSGSAQPNRKKVASVTWEQVKAIAEDKMNDLNCFTVESAMRLIAGTARSMGITVKGDFPE